MEDRVGEYLAFFSICPEALWLCWLLAWFVDVVCGINSVYVSLPTLCDETNLLEKRANTGISSALLHWILLPTS